MRTTIAASATFLLLGAGAAGVGAKSNIHMLGSDTLHDLTVGVLAGIPAISTPPLPAVAACPGTSGLVYDGTGSGNGANAMRRGDQEAAPMSSPLSAANVCAAGLAAGLPTAGQEAEGEVIAVDGVSIAVRPGNAPDSACGGVAFSGAGGAKLTVAGGCAAGDGCNGANEYIPSDAKDYLRVLYFGITGHSASSTVRNCGGNVRKALVAKYTNLFQNQGTCTGGTGASSCAGKKLKHAYRRDDASGTTDVFAAVIGIPGIYGGYNKLTYATGQQTNGYCNAGDVGSDHSTKGIHLGFDDSQVPLVGPNWNALIGDSDFADLDPLRVTCESGDEVCNGDGTNGVVQVVFVSDGTQAQNYPPQACDGGSVELVLDVTSAPYDGYFGRCGDGSPSLLGGCVIPYKSCTAGSPCVKLDGSTQTTGVSYMCRQVSGLGNCFALSPAGTSGIDGSECRGNNNWMRNADGSLFQDSSLGAAKKRPFLGAFFRKHMTKAGTGGTGTCQLPSATAQIGCLVGAAEPCSIGYAGREATDGAGAPADAASVGGVPPSKSAIQALVSSDDATFAGRYPLSRKLFYNTIIGFGSSFNTVSMGTPDPTGNGVSGEELNLGKCLVNPSYKPYWEAKYGFIELPGNSFCEDFVEYRSCSGGLRPGKKCTADADCTGFGAIPAGTCNVTPNCAGATAETDACANNASVAMP